jgi:hypothetical protein
MRAVGRPPFALDDALVAEADGGAATPLVGTWSAIEDALGNERPGAEVGSGRGGSHAR